MFGLKKPQAAPQPVPMTAIQMEAVRKKLDLIRALKRKIDEIEGVFGLSGARSRFSHLDPESFIYKGAFKLKVSRDLKDAVDLRTGDGEEVMLVLDIDQSVLEILKHELKKRLSAAQADARRLGAAEEDL